MVSGEKTGKNKDKGVFIIYLTAAGQKLAQKLKGCLYPEAQVMKFQVKPSPPGGEGEIKESTSPNPLQSWRGFHQKQDLLSFSGVWPAALAILFIGAAGVAVRAIAPFIKDKREDPAVVVMDEKGQNVISLLSGHAGGANRLAGEIAGFLGGNPVITTATDINSLTPVDVFAAENDLEMETPKMLPSVSARHLEKKKLSVYLDSAIELPPDYEKAGKPEDADVLITGRIYGGKNYFYLRPKDIALGVGFNSGTKADEIEKAVTGIFNGAGFSALSIGLIGTHVKKASEAGLIEFARRRGLKIRGFESSELNAVSTSAVSEAALRALGARAVAEPAAILAAAGAIPGASMAIGPGSKPELIIEKQKAGKNVTVAAAKLERHKENTLTVVGTGPGGRNHLTPEAMDAIREADCIVGYKSYLAHIGPLIKGKEVVSASMTEEVLRTKKAVELAKDGKKVCLISGGDPGIYGMAGLALEVAANMAPDLKVDIVPGISALNACASRLGAPLMHDFAVISLSDRLTPWEVIEKRLEAAAKADFVTVLYNPKSGGRRTQIERARQIMLAHRDGKTPVGIVTDATRAEEEVVVTTLDEMLRHEINMKSTVIIGNSMSRRMGGKSKILTPRGYERKYSL